MTTLLAVLFASLALVATGCSSDADETHVRSYIAEGLRVAEVVDELTEEAADDSIGETLDESAEAESESAEPGEPSSSADETAESADAAGEPITVCSFNIRFLGNYFDKENEHLADMLSYCDVVIVQELVAPPSDGIYPDGTSYSADIEAKAFSDAMEAAGFSTLLSEEDTGSGEEIHKASSATEWWVAYYKSESVVSAPDLPGGFLAEDRSAHPVYRRVPYGFGFRSADGAADFVLISVHLDPEDDEVRYAELNEIGEWIEEHNDQEKDFIILGDMNIQDEDELDSCTPDGFVSMNSDCCPTNTKPDAPKPYDHVMYNPEHTAREIDADHGLWIVDLLVTMEPYWSDTYEDPYPGGDGTEGYDHDVFYRHYSDHHPVEFRITASGSDDD